MWTQLLSIITVVVSLAIIFKKYPGEVRDIRYLSISALFLWLCGDIVISINVPYLDLFHVLLQSLALSILLIVYLIFIRQRKPIIFRYPYYLVFFPLLIPVAQIIVMETEIMREIIFMALHGVSIMVFILLAVGYAQELKHKLLTIIGVLLLLWGFAFYWILQNYYIVFEWAWAFTNSVGMIACIYSFSDLITANENKE
ncbi:MAG: hypothetical protein R3220_07620 [Balneolaceae bacterium]|nr:hypothetical protein [Balneolaceae bacterium]